MGAYVVSAREASKLLNMSLERTLEWLDRGELPGYRVETRWKIPVQLLQSYVIERAEREAEERRKVYEEVQSKREQHP